MIPMEKDRLECLKLAVNLNIPHKLSQEKMAEQVIACAEKFYQFITKEPTPATGRADAEVNAYDPFQCGVCDSAWDTRDRAINCCAKAKSERRAAIKGMVQNAQEMNLP